MSSKLQLAPAVNTEVIKEWESIAQECLDVPQELKQQVYDYAFRGNNKDGHSWLLIDTVGGRIFNRFDEIITSTHDV